MSYQGHKISELVLATPRIVACLWRDGDQALLRELHSTSEMTSYIAGEMPWTDEKALIKLEKYRSEHDRDGTGKYKLISKQDGKFLGRAGVSAYDKVAGEYELGYVLKQEYWGQGLATEIASAIMDHFFTLALAPQLIAFSDHGNRRSHRVLHKIGMRQLGSRLVGGSPALEFSITQAEWMNPPSVIINN